MLRTVTIADDANARGIGGVFLSDPWQSGVADIFQVMDGSFVGLKGYVNSPQAGTLDVYQGTKADIDGVTAAAPAAGTSNGLLVLNTFAHPGGAAFVGTQALIPVVGTHVRIRYTNGGVVQTGFRLHFEGTE